MINFRTVAVLLLVMLSWPVPALDFFQAIKLAEKSDPAIREAEYHYQSVLETVPQSKSSLLPQLELNIYTRESQTEISNSSDPATIANGETSYKTDGYRLSLSQSIYNHGLYLALDQSDINVARAVVELEAERQALIIRVAMAYYAVLAAKDNLRFAHAEKKAIERQLEQAQKRFDVGLTAVTDVKEARAQYDLAVAQEIMADNKVLTAREALKVIIGDIPGELENISSNLQLVSPEPADIEQWVTFARQNNPLLKSASYGVESAQKQVAINRSGHYPSLSFQLSQEYSTPDGGSFVVRDTEDTTAMLELNVPLYSGGLTRSKTRQAIADVNKNKASYDRVLRQVLQQVRDSYLGVVASIAQVKALKQALISTQTAYQATQAGFQVGTRTAVEVLTVLREQYRAERDYARARYDYILNILYLKQAAGVLSEQDVKQVNQWLTEK
ncbi:MAG: TolC family outer membrane protein [Gammaproteobacteria bacterium]|nr:TolC family outer membrane protein [Gammaproteobacteria bacterium]